MAAKLFNGTTKQLTEKQPVAMLVYGKWRTGKISYSEGGTCYFEYSKKHADGTTDFWVEEVKESDIQEKKLKISSGTLCKKCKDYQGIIFSNKPESKGKIFICPDCLGL